MILKPEHYQNTRQQVVKLLIILVAIVITFAIMHFFFSDLKVGGIRLFNLDKEKNLPAWFSGVLFAGFGFAALTAFYIENYLNVQKKQIIFRMSIFWLGVGFAGLAMSLDEVTILHENLFWKEVRQISNKVDPSLIQVTQWQLIFAPVIVLLFSYFVLFFSNRYYASKAAIFSAFSGLGIWVMAILIEGLRTTFKNMGDTYYFISVIFEESFEMIGAILLIGSIIFYTIDIYLDLTDDRLRKLQLGKRFFSIKTIIQLVIVALAFLVLAGIIWFAAVKLKSKGASAPTLHQKAIEETVVEAIGQAQKNADKSNDNSGKLK